MDRDGIELRVVARPYIAYLILGGWAPLYLLYGVIVTPENRESLLYALLTIVGLFLWIFVALWSYRVRLRDGVLSEAGFLRPRKLASVSSIRRWRYEVGWANQKWLWWPTLRPFRRIAIYYKDGTTERHLDVSLNVFARERVDELLNAVRVLRPDLDLPRGFSVRAKS